MKKNYIKTVYAFGRIMYEAHSWELGYIGLFDTWNEADRALNGLE